jgi:hypothetical protein
MPESTESLLAHLETQRRHVLGIMEGLDESQLRRPVLPSGWSCLGMIQHLALSVEHYWFRCVMGGESLGFFRDAQGGDLDDWAVSAEERAERVLATYRDEIDRANAVIASMALDDPPRQRDEWWGDWAVPDLRYVMMHVITETACHAGHLDAARELLDGRQWLVL